ncbi:MAG: hypothetical protein HDQ88_12060 [Clostridia bacterium]|nr:hypothetical protein [Clostridia bacterium]
MKKILLLVIMAIGLVGCNIAVKTERGNNTQFDLACINGHLYKETRDAIYITLYDYRTDTPTLIQCRKTKNGIEYEKEKIK